MVVGVVVVVAWRGDAVFGDVRLSFVVGRAGSSMSIA